MVWTARNEKAALANRRENNARGVGTLNWSQNVLCLNCYQGWERLEMGSCTVYQWHSTQFWTGLHAHTDKLLSALTNVYFMQIKISVNNSGTRVCKSVQLWMQHVQSTDSLPRFTDVKSGWTKSPITGVDSIYYNIKEPLLPWRTQW